MELSEELTEAQVARIYASIGRPDRRRNPPPARTTTARRREDRQHDGTDGTDSAQSAQSSADTPQVEEMGME